MNRYIIKKSKLQGEITIPPSKSQTLRAILFGTLASGKSIIYDYLPGSDTKSMVEACRSFGATITILSTHMEITGLSGEINGAEDVINAGNSGIVLRFCSGLSALSTKPIVITGDYSIRHLRAMQPLIDALAKLGVKAISTKEDGFAPVIIQGPVTKTQVIISGQDSQGVSALLIALNFVKESMEIFVENPGERPWVLMTLNWLDRFKIPYVNKNFEHYQLFGSSKIPGFEYLVPGDLSSASFPIAAALITDSEITLKNIDMTDCQGDKELIYLFQKMGALIEFDHPNKMIHVKKGGKLSGVTVDINDFIDAVTILAVIGCYAEGKTHIYNAKGAKGKECNRLHAITTELKKMNANIQETEDGLIVQKSNLIGAKVNSYNDHRMCMALGCAGLGANGETEISDVECVGKTFPSFLEDFKALQANITLQKASHGK